MTGTALLVLAIAATYANRDGTGLRVGTARLCDDTGLSDKTVRRALAAGAKIGYLHRDHRGHRRGDGTCTTSEYRLTLPLPVTRDRLSTVDSPVDPALSTGHPVPVEAISTGQTDPLYRSLTTPLPVTGDHPPVVDQEDHPRARARGRAREACGRCIQPGCWLPDGNGERSAQHGPCYQREASA